MALRHLRLIAAAGMLGGCASSIEGGFQTTGAQGWKLAPNTCTSGFHHGYLGVDLFRLDPADDTEVVVIAEAGVAHILARLPGRGQMVRLKQPDCTVFDVDVHENGVTVNDIPALAGHVTLDCERAELARLVGTATFSCY